MKFSQLRKLIKEIVKEVNSEVHKIYMDNLSKENFAKVVLPSIFKNITVKGKKDFQIMYDPPAIITWDDDIKETTETILQGLGFEKGEDKHPFHHWKAPNEMQ